MTIIDEFKSKIRRGQIIFRGQAVRDLVDYAAGLEENLSDEQKRLRAELETTRADLEHSRQKWQVEIGLEIAKHARTKAELEAAREQLTNAQSFYETSEKVGIELLQAAREDADRLAKAMLLKDYDQSGTDGDEWCSCCGGLGYHNQDCKWQAALAAHEALKGQP